MPEGEGEVMLAGGSGCDSGLACLRNHLISKKNLDFVRRCERWNLGWLYHHCTKQILFLGKAGRFKVNPIHHAAGI